MAHNNHGRIIPFKERIAERINVGKIVGRLSQHIDGDIEMTATQIQAARILLNKVVPDVKALEIKHVDRSNAQAIDNASLRAIIDGTAKRIDK